MVLPKNLCCPVNHEPLVPAGAVLRGAAKGEEYTLVDGIPIMIADPAQRTSLLKAAADPASEEASAVRFYNDPAIQETYKWEEHPAVRRTVQAWLQHGIPEGPTVEVGSGRGAAQGVSPDYVAVDYSLTCLRRYIRPEYPRICASAESLPFLDNSVSCLFSIATLEHVPRPDLAFAEVDRVLKPGGLACLAPAWHCTRYNCEGLACRAYRELTLRQKLIKLSIPFRQLRLVKALHTLPGRLWRRVAWNVAGRGPTRFRYQCLPATYDRFWGSDCDACSRLDAHEGCLYFQSRGYQILSPGPGWARQLLATNIVLIARKPENPVLR